MDDSTLKPQVYTSKDKTVYDDNAAVLASMIPFYLLNSYEATDIVPFSDDSNTTSTDSIFSDNSDVSSMDSFIDCSI